MEKVWKKIEDIISNNDIHKRKGIVISQQKPKEILQHALEELIELNEAPDDIEEMADILNCLVHYCQKKEWSQEDIEKAMIKKLDERVGPAPIPTFKLFERLKKIYKRCKIQRKDHG